MNPTAAGKHVLQDRRACAAAPSDAQREAGGQWRDERNGAHTDNAGGGQGREGGGGASDGGDNHRLVHGRRRENSCESVETWMKYL